MLAGQSLGIREVDDGIWLAGFMHYNLGYFDLKQKTLQPLDNPFGTRLSPMSQVRGVTYVSGLDTQRAGGEGGIPDQKPRTLQKHHKTRHSRKGRRRFATTAVYYLYGPKSRFSRTISRRSKTAACAPATRHSAVPYDLSPQEVIEYCAK